MNTNYKPQTKLGLMFAYYFVLIHFQYKELLWLLTGAMVLAILFLLVLKWKHGVRKGIGDEKLVDALIDGYSSPLFLLKFIFLLLAFTACVIAAMNPREPGRTLTTRKGIDIAIALDVSKSMLATDLAPNRMERAKQFITKLLSSMPNDRVALVLFAGKAYLQMPLTVDHNAARLFVLSAGPDAVPQQGTVIGDALEKSAYALSGTDTKFKSIVLISDGEDHQEDALSIAKDLSTQGVMINAIGIGSTEGSTIFDPATGDLKKDDAGSPVITRLNEDILRELASVTNGVYTRLESSDAAVALLKEQFSTIDRKAHTDFSQVNFKTYYAWLIVPALMLLIIELFIPERRKKTVAVLKLNKT